MTGQRCVAAMVTQ